MAPKTPPAPPAPPADNPPQEVPADATPKAADFDWGTLDAPIAMPNRQAFAGFTVDVLTKVPAAIRERCEKSLTANVARVARAATSTAARPRVDYHWDIQLVPTQARGAEFVKLVTKYAKYRPDTDTIEFATEGAPKGQVTARCGDVVLYRKTDEGTYVVTSTDGDDVTWGVRYSVRPLEQRTQAQRLPGAA